jgi:curved DNA-binding protein CbpA
VNFDPKKDYYGILGVTSSAEMAVIKAAYKALAGIYHPDRNPSNEAVAKMQAINEAWDILSNKETKKQYDSVISNRKPENDAFEDIDENEEVDEYFEKDWILALNYYPDLAPINERLSIISRRLAIAYRAYILAEKKFNKRGLIAVTMEEEFLHTYFSSNAEIIEVARLLIFDVKNKALLKELNNAVTTLGTTDPAPILERFRSEIDMHRSTNLKTNRQKEQVANHNDSSIVNWLLWMIIGSTGIIILIGALG